VLIASPEYGHRLPGALKKRHRLGDRIGGAGTQSGGDPPRGPRRRTRATRAPADTLGAVSAKVVGGEPIARGPNFEREVAELVQSLVATVTSAPPE